MGLLGKLFKKESAATPSSSSAPKGFYTLEVLGVHRLTADSVKVEFAIPSNLKDTFAFEAGQYIDLAVDIQGQKERRSYSICSGPNENLAIGVKCIEGGKVSTWATSNLQAGMQVFVAPPKGNFTVKPEAKKLVAIAAGSGITPILSIAKSVEGTDKTMELFYGNRSVNSILFHDEIQALNNTKTQFFLSREQAEGYADGRIGKEQVIAIIKSNLDLLKYDGFYLCGPEELIFGAVDALNLFGVPKSKIFFELFQTPVGEEEEKEEVVAFTGKSKVTVILDDEKVSFEMEGRNNTLLDAANGAGLDAPYSCRGGVCSTCRCKIISGQADMNINFSLTDDEIKKGYILACQAHPISEELVITFDE